MVRCALEDEGIRIPQDTRFIAALHDTTTDAITLFDADKVPLSHETDLLQLQLWLEEGSKRCRQQRAASLGLASAEEAELDQLIHERSRDWSQVRPEWGLAGNAAFIAAPRERTRHLNLGGRVFLHNYRHSADTMKSTLELIMTAPMVVANWINLQYYASTVNNRLWGSGNKVTHNVVGTFGIQQGNGGEAEQGEQAEKGHGGLARRSLYAAQAGRKGKGASRPVGRHGGDRLLERGDPVLHLLHAVLVEDLHALPLGNALQLGCLGACRSRQRISRW
jgi:uncharacterized protein YbcC (UPF0753/DUF2309 family)